MDEEEELAQHFYSKLAEPKANTGLILAQFYSTFYKKDLDQRLIAGFGRLVRLYGRNITFLALLDVFDVETIEHTSIIGFVVYFIKQRLIAKFSNQENVDLSPSIAQSLKDLKKIQKQKLKGVDNPFDA